MRCKEHVLSTVFLIGVDGFRKSCRQLIFWIGRPAQRRLQVDTVSDTSNLTRTTLTKTCLQCCRSRCLGRFYSLAAVSFFLCDDLGSLNTHALSYTHCWQWCPRNLITGLRLQFRPAAWSSS